MSEKKYDMLNKRIGYLASAIDVLKSQVEYLERLRYPKFKTLQYLSCTPTSSVSTQEEIKEILLKDAVEAIITHLNIDLETTDAIPSKVVAKRRPRVRKT